MFDTQNITKTIEQKIWMHYWKFISLLILRQNLSKWNLIYTSSLHYICYQPFCHNHLLISIHIKHKGSEEPSMNINWSYLVIRYWSTLTTISFLTMTRLSKFRSNIRLVLQFRGDQFLALVVFCNFVRKTSDKFYVNLWWWYGKWWIKK